MAALINGLLYQTVWLLCIIGGYRGAILAIGLLILHLVLAAKGSQDLPVMLLFLLAGLTLDGLLQMFGFFTFSESGWPIPFWLAVIWMGFATTVNHSLSWLKTRPHLCSLFGAVGGPLAYWGGCKLGAASFQYPMPISLVFLSAIWALVVPLLFSGRNILTKRAR